MEYGIAIIIVDDEEGPEGDLCTSHKSVQARARTDANRLYLTNSTGHHKFYHTAENVDRDLLNKHHLATVTKSVLQTLKRDEDGQEDLIVGAVNVRSLQKHVEDVLCFSETGPDCTV